jgi:cytochrome c2
LASRLPILIAPILLLAGGCERAGADVRAGETCRACHGDHAPRHRERGPCASCHGGDPAAARKALAHHRLISGRAAEYGLRESPAAAEGRGRVERLACRRCHTLDGSGNRLATNLDRIAWKRDQGELARSIGKPVENMPRFGLDRGQTEAVIAYLLRSADPKLGAATYRVRFSKREAARDSVFETRCGGCHRALGAASPLGRGSAGPNLSGIFTTFYPPTAPGGRPWTPATLERWLENPRALRPGTAMRPVRLEARDFRILVEELGGEELRPGGTWGESSDTLRVRTAP